VAIVVGPGPGPGPRHPLVPCRRHPFLPIVPRLLLPVSALRAVARSGGWGCCGGGGGAVISSRSPSRPHPRRPLVICPCCCWPCRRCRRLPAIYLLPPRRRLLAPAIHPMSSGS
jgi:hypothetical protein